METISYPYDDDYMKYDLVLHRYTTTRTAVETYLGIKLELVLNTSFDANPTAAAERFLKKASNMVYGFIYQHNLNPAWFEYIMAKHAPLRTVILRMLLAQVEYMLSNGIVSDYSGVNIAKGNVIDIAKLRGTAKIADEVEQLANLPIEGLGYCLLYSGTTPMVLKSNLYKGY